MLHEIAYDYDVVVCGGGPAGIMAAIAAARNGACTILLEQYAFLGGNAAMFLPIMTFHDHLGHQIIQGIPQEFIDRIAALGGSAGHHLCACHCSVTCVDGETLKYVAQEMCLEAGVTLLLHSPVTETTVEDGCLRSVVVENKSGRQVIRGKVFIDATGDGDVAARAGAPYEMGRPEDGSLQPPTFMFRMGNVDMARFMADVLARGKGEAAHVHYDYQAYLHGYQFIFFGCDDYVRQAQANGELPVPWTFIFVTTPRLGEVAINMGKVPGTIGTDALSLTHAEIEGRRQMFTIVPFLQKYIPGFEGAHLIDSAHQIGIRESRRITGEYTLTGADLLHNPVFPDSIALGGYMIDLHSPAGIGNVAGDILEHGYHIPYRALVPLGVEHLLTAGRCISVDWTALGSTRVMAICMAIGQAAGTAAAVAVRQQTTPRLLDVAEVQRLLVRDKALIDYPSMYDEQQQGFFSVHARVDALAEDGQLTLICSLKNVTNQTARADVHIHPHSNLTFEQPSFITGDIAPFSEQSFTLQGRVAPGAPAIEYLLQLHYTNGPRIEKTLCHLLPAHGLREGWESGEWQSFAPAAQQFRGDAGTATLHGARCNLSYDARGLQLLLDVRDDFLRPSDAREHAGLTNVDYVELFLDGRAAGDVGAKPYAPGVYQLLLYPGDPVKTPAFYHLCGKPAGERLADFTLSSVRTAQGYRLTAFLPFSSFCVAPAPPAKLGFDLAVCTVNAQGGRIAQYHYAGGTDNWKDASGFREVLMR